MKNLSSRSIANRKKYPSETIDSEIVDWHSQHRLPRHISALTTQSHRGKGNSGKHNGVFSQPKACAIDACQPQQTNAALNILKYQLSDRASLQKHHGNLLANLKHRLQKAKDRGDSQLWNLLQDEYQQLINS